jgi:hypothetical protein
MSYNLLEKFSNLLIFVYCRTFYKKAKKFIVEARTPVPPQNPKFGRVHNKIS